MYRYNGYFIIRKEPFIEWIAATGGELTQYLWKQRRLKVAISKKDSTLENNRGLLKCSPEIMMVPFKCMAASAPFKLQYALNRNICQIHCIYTIHGCKCCSKIKMAGTNFMK